MWISTPSFLRASYSSLRQTTSSNSINSSEQNPFCRILLNKIEVTPETLEIIYVSLQITEKRLMAIDEMIKLQGVCGDLIDPKEWKCIKNFEPNKHITTFRPSGLID